MEIEIEGIDGLLKKLRDLEDQGTRAENKALRAAGDVIRDAIMSETPEHTGALKRSINRSNVKVKDGVKHVEVGPDRPGKRSHVARFLEYGTVKMKANPFMSRGYEKSKSEAMAKLANELRKGLKL